jgi:hypothetical protein
MRQLLAMAAPRPSIHERFPPESAAARVNESEHCAILHKSDRTCNLPTQRDIALKKQVDFQPDAIR